MVRSRAIWIVLPWVLAGPTGCAYPSLAETNSAPDGVHDAPTVVAGTSNVHTEPDVAHATDETNAGRSKERIELLTVTGFGPAVVSVPPGETPRPLVVAAHGAGGRPEWDCTQWSTIVGARGFVLCPRGKRIDARVSYDRAHCYFPHHYYLRDVVRASRSALLARYPDRVDAERAVYVGFSQGAIMGALVVGAAPHEFARALFVEGGGGQWNIPIAERYARNGGKRIAFLCGTLWCGSPARESEHWLNVGGVQSRTVYVPGGGHTAGGAVGQRIPELLAWVVADDPRWLPAGQ